MLQLAEILSWAAINAVFVAVVIRSTDEGMLFQAYGDWMESKEQEWAVPFPGVPFWGKPLFYCAFCTAFWTGILSYFWLFDAGWPYMVAYISVSCFLAEKFR